MIMLNFLFQFLIQISFILSFVQPNYGFCQDSKSDLIERVILENIPNRHPLIANLRKSLIKVIGGENLDNISLIFKHKVKVTRLTPVDVYIFMRNLYATRDDLDSDEKILHIAKQLNFLMLQTDLLYNHNYTLSRGVECSFIESGICKDKHYHKFLAAIIDESFKLLKTFKVEPAYLEDPKSYARNKWLNSRIDLITLIMFLHLKKTFLYDEVQPKYLEGSEFDDTFTEERFNQLKSFNPLNLSKTISNELKGPPTIRIADYNFFNPLDDPEFSELKEILQNYLEEKGTLKIRQKHFSNDYLITRIAERLSTLILETDLFYNSKNDAEYQVFSNLLLSYYRKLQSNQRKTFLQIFLKKMSSLKISQNFSSFIEDEIKSPSFSLKGYLNLYSYTIHMLNPQYPEISPVGYISHNYLINWSHIHFR